MSEEEKTKLINKICLITLICLFVIGIIVICIDSKPSSYSHSVSSSSSNNCGGPGKCKYKVGGNYVCNRPATNGNFCETHWDYLYSAYNSVVDDYNSLIGGN